MRMLALLELARAHSAVGGALAVWLGARLAGAEWSWSWLYPMTVAFLLCAAGNAYNDVQDVALDKINRPTRPLPRGALTLTLARTFAFACTTLAFLLVLPLGFISTFGTITGIGLLFWYSHGLKRIPLVGNGTVGLLTGMTVGFGGLLAGDVAAVVLPGVALGLLFGGREVLKTIYDEAGDRAHAIPTATTRWGPRNALAIATVVLLLGWLVLTWWGWPSYSWVVILTLALILTTLLPLWRAPRSRRAAAWALRWSKGAGLVMLVGLLYFVRG